MPTVPFCAVICFTNFALTRGWLNNEAVQTVNWTFFKPMAYTYVFGSGISADLEHSHEHIVSFLVHFASTASSLFLAARVMT